MKVSEAKAMVLALIGADLRRSGAAVGLDAASPDPTDEGKFVLDGKPARVIHHFSGWHVPIELSWFAGSFDPPRINGGAFHWYVFAVPALRRLRRDHYFVCDYVQMRDWVLEFAAPRGNDHRDHRDWLAAFRVFPGETQAYMRWGDEPVDFVGSLGRVIALDNVATIADLRQFQGLHVGAFGPGGESEAHRRLKLYVAEHPGIIGLSTTASPDVEHRFRTDDRVDILFNNHRPNWTVVEVEVEGEDALVTGVHQAIKYRSLAEAEVGVPLQSPTVRAQVVAYETAYPQAIATAARYGVHLVSVDRHAVLGTGGT